MVTARWFGGLIALVALALVVLPKLGDAHYDTLNGPVVSAAQVALQ